MIKDTLDAFDLDIIFRHRKKLAKYRSGSVAIIFHKKLREYINILNSKTQDVLWFTLNFEGFKMLFGNCYIPPEGSKFFKYDIFEQIDLDLIQFSINTTPDGICIAGDFNAKTKCDTDYVNIDPTVAIASNIHEEMIDELNMEENFELLDIQKHRNNRDSNPINKPGKELLNFCKNHNLLIANDRVGYDRHIGNFTTKEKSTIDYALSSPNLLKNITYCEIDTFDPLFSDIHKGIDFSLKFALYEIPKNFTKPKNTIPKKN